MNPRAETYRRLQNIPARLGHRGQRGNPWCSATWATRRRRASPSPATLRPARTSFTASSSSTHRARTSSAGIRTPQNITEAARIEAGSDKPSMETALPAVFKEFQRTTSLLERHYREMQDMEFTVEGR